MVARSGAGRKPKGPYRGKNSTITTRVRAGTRAALELAAQQSGRSLSQEIEHRLDTSFLKKNDAPSHIRAFAHAVVLLTVNLERQTGKPWFESPFTGIALQNGIDALIRHFRTAEKGEINVPEKLEQMAKSLDDTLKSSFLNPAALGVMEAGAIITSIERYAIDPDAYRDNSGSWQILQEIGSGWIRNRSPQRRK